MRIRGRLLEYVPSTSSFCCLWEYDFNRSIPLSHYLKIKHLCQVSNRNVNIRYAAMCQIPCKLLEIGNACAHSIHEMLDRNNFDACIDDTHDDEDCHIRTDSLDHKRILSELNFNAQLDIRLYKIHVSKGLR